MFNSGRYVARAAADELITRVMRDHHPSSPKARVPFCTRSQSIAYFDRKGDEVATAHQYLLPNGRLGASGQPDPKRILHDGILYVAWWEPKSG